MMLGERIAIVKPVVSAEAVRNGSGGARIAISMDGDKPFEFRGVKMNGAVAEISIDRAEALIDALRVALMHARHMSNTKAA